VFQIVHKQELDPHPGSRYRCTAAERPVRQERKPGPSITCNSVRPSSPVVSRIVVNCSDRNNKRLVSLRPFLLLETEAPRLVKRSTWQSRVPLGYLHAHGWLLEAFPDNYRPNESLYWRACITMVTHAVLPWEASPPCQSPLSRYGEPDVLLRTTVHWESVRMPPLMRHQTKARGSRPYRRTVNSRATS